MNLITTTAVYQGVTSLPNKVNTLIFTIDGTGKKPVAVPIFLIPSFAARETSVPGAYELGTKLLINGRLYPNSEDGKMYVVPTQELQPVSKELTINQVHLAGGIGFIDKQHNENVFNFGLMCKAPPQKSLGHTWQDSLPFRAECWNDEARRMKKFVYVGRQMALGGALKFETWIDKNNEQCSRYKVRIKAAQYSFFGKNQKSEEVVEKQPLKQFDSPHHQAMSTPPVKTQKDDDEIPF